MPGRLLQGVDEAGDAVRQAIRAYHGSPYDFDRFDASKIGTGEGNQSFGHGLYFAGNENVARQYRDSLSGHQILIDGSPMATGMSDWTRDWAGRLASGLDVSRELKGLRRSLEAAQTERALLATQKVRAQNLEDRLRAYESLAGKDVRYNQGRMYEVEIAHPESALLDWDAPMSKQPKVVQRAFGDMAMDMPGDGGRVYRDIATRRGEEFDDDMTGVLADRAAAQELLAEGIPGIRYLDQGSRAAGEGTRNYVIFPGAEDQIRILRKYGVMAPVATGAAMEQE